MCCYRVCESRGFYDYGAKLAMECAKSEGISLENRIDVLHRAFQAYRDQSSNCKYM